MTGSRHLARAIGPFVVALVVAGAAVTVAHAQDAVTASPAGDRSPGHCLTSYSLEESTRDECRMKAASELSFAAISPFGSLPFAVCEIGYAIHFESGGGVAVDGIALQGPSPCGDIRPCKDLWSAEPRPWTGSVVTRGHDGFAIVLRDACLDTCIGWFEGRLRLALDRIHGRWRVRSTQSQIGGGGLELRGDSWLEGRDVRLDRS